MKKLLILLLLAAPQIGQAQSKIEANVFRLLNEYRVSKGLLPVAYDSTLSKAAEYQAEYECLIGEVTHKQKIDLPNFNEINSFADRIFQLSGLDYKPVAEITTGLNEYLYEVAPGDTIRFSYYDEEGNFKRSILYNFTKDREKDLAFIILNNYKVSRGHNEALILPSDGNLKVGISCRRKIDGNLYNVIVFSN